MNKILKIVFGSLFILAMLQATPLKGQGSDDFALRIAELKTGIDSLESRLDRLIRRKGSLELEADRLASEVSGLKDRLDGKVSRLGEYRLRERLRESQSLADSLDSLNFEAAELERRLGARRRIVTGLYTAAIDSASIRLEATNNSLEYEKILVRIRNLRRERAVFSSQTETLSAARPRENGSLSLEKLKTAVRVGYEDSPEEIREKADFLGDIAGKWSRALSRLEDKLERLAEESAIRSRLSEFAQEISLFDDAGLSSRAGVKTAAGPEPGAQETSLDEPREEKVFSSVNEEQGLPDGSGQLESFDLELFDPEGDLWLLQNLENLSPEGMETAIGLIEARRDSISNDLEQLRKLEKSLRKLADGIGEKEEGGPEK